MLELRQAFRHLQRSRSFTAAAILSLAVGLAFCTASLSILTALMWRPLGVTDPSGLFAVTSVNSDGQARPLPIPAVEILSASGPLEDVCAYSGGGIFAVEANKEPTQALGAFITGGCLEKTFGVVPVLGRSIEHVDAPLWTAGRPVAVIGHRFWQRIFNGSPDVLGQTLTIEGVELSIVGVMPEGFVGLQIDSGIDIFCPFDTVIRSRADRRPGASQFLGRLPKGIDVGAAESRLSVIWAGLLESVVPGAASATERQVFLDSRPLLESMRYGISPLRTRFASSAQFGLALASLLLLITAINLGGALVIRVVARRSEFGLLMALGATRSRIYTQVIFSALIICAGSSLLALPLAYVAVDVFASFMPTDLLERAMSFRPDSRVLAGMIGIAALSAVSISLLPAWLLTRSDVAGNSRTDRTVVSSSSKWVRRLVSAQIALCVAIVGCAALLVQTAINLGVASVGVSKEGVSVIRVRPLPGAYRNINNGVYYPELLERISQVPGVNSVGFSRFFPRLVIDGLMQPVGLPGETLSDRRAQVEVASPRFFETVGIPLLEGRDFNWSDNANGEAVGIVNQLLSTMLGGDDDTVGLRVRVGLDKGDQQVRIVGVVGNASLGSARFSLPILYRPPLQVGALTNFPNIVVSSGRTDREFVASLRRVVQEGKREYAHEVSSLDGVFLKASAQERLAAATGFAAAVSAIALTFWGVYAILGYTVSLRTREIAVRLALGAERTAIAGMILRNLASMVVVGLVIGLPLTMGVGRSLKALLFNVSESDPAVALVTLLIIVAVCSAAALIPAIRASRVDCTDSLKES